MNILLLILLLILHSIIAQPVPSVLTRIATNTFQKASGGLILSPKVYSGLTLPSRVPVGLTLPPLGPSSFSNLPLGFKPPNIHTSVKASFVNPQSRTASVSESLSRTASVSESLSRTASTVSASTVTIPVSVSTSTVTVSTSTVTVSTSTVTVPTPPETPRYVPSTISMQRIDSGYSQKDEIIKHVNDIGKSVVNDLKEMYGTGTNYNFDINNNGRIRPQGDNFINIKHNGHQIAHLTLYDKPTSVSGHRLSSIHLGVIDGSKHHHYYMVNVDSQYNIIWRKEFANTPVFSDQVHTVANSISDYFIQNGLNVPK